jgi:hypothetical protein
MLGNIDLESTAEFPENAITLRSQRNANLALMQRHIAFASELPPPQCGYSSESARIAFGEYRADMRRILENGMRDLPVSLLQSLLEHRWSLSGDAPPVPRAHN